MNALRSMNFREFACKRFRRALVRRPAEAHHRVWKGGDYYEPSVWLAEYNKSLRCRLVLLTVI